MRRLPLLLAFLILAAPAAAPAQEWRRAPEYDVLLANNEIAPRTINLKAGVPVRLRFVNNTNSTQVFSADGFFSNAQLRRRDTKDVSGGRVKVRPGQSRTIALVPKAGRYKAGSSNILRRLLGMNGTIVVE